MCGIFGVLSAHSINKNQGNFLIDAFQTGVVRGHHGTGMITVQPDGSASGVSRAIAGGEFLSDDKTRKHLDKASRAKLVVGHNRFTTSGENIDEHCHPFEYENVIGVHNGSVPDGPLQKIDPDKSHVVDSSRIYAALDKADDPIEVLKHIHTGAYALVWYDRRDKSLYMARNGQRPLHIAETAGGLVFSSELGMLGWLIARNSLAYKNVSAAA